MKQLDDKEIQKLIEEKVTAKESASLSNEDKNDLELYQLLYKVLEEEPEEGPSYYFSKKVSMALQAEIKPESSKKFYFSLGLILTFSIAVAFGILLYIDENYQTGLVNMVLSSKWIIILSFAGFFAIQYADQKILMGKLPAKRR
jgi:hypothetical protein